MARLLLDTNVVLFALLRPDRLTRKARDAMDARDAERFVSAATWYEISWKVACRALDLGPGRTADEAVALMRARGLAVTPAHMARAADLPPDLRDPFDRMIVAQALEDGLTLVSADAGLDVLGAPRLW